MSYKNTPDAWKMDGMELSVEQKLNDVYDIASTAAAGALPSVSSADNGKALLVKSGKWQKAAIPSQLPTVSADDNGDVLTVVEGAWAKAAAGGGSSGLFPITVTVSGDTLTLNKTFSEIITALSNGLYPVVTTYEGDENEFTFYNYIFAGLTGDSTHGWSASLITFDDLSGEATLNTFVGATGSDYPTFTPDN